MQHGNQTPLDDTLSPPDCAFCQHDKITDILKETPHFLLAAYPEPFCQVHSTLHPPL